MRLDPELVLAVSLSVLVTACARDLDLPAPSGAPRIESFSPVRGYAGQQLVIRGSGFDVEPAGNLLQFASGSVRAESVSGGTLTARIPAGAGDGSFTITTKGGVSAPSPAAFTYLGRGALSAHAITTEYPLLHKPYRVVPARDETYVHSDLVVGLLRYGDATFVDPHAVALDHARWTSPDPSVVWLETYEDDGPPAVYVSTLVKNTVNVSGAVTRTAVTLPSPMMPAFYIGSAGGVTAMRAATYPAVDAVAVFRFYADDLGNRQWTVELRRLDTLAAYAAEAVIPAVYELRGCVDAGGGELACLGRDQAYSSSVPLRLFKIHLDSGAPPTVTFAATPATAIAENRQVNSLVKLQDPLCADPATHVAYVGLTDGRLGQARVDTMTSGTVLTTTSTGSRTPARSLTCVPATGGLSTTVLVAKRDDDLLTRLDPSGAGSVIWSAAVPAASVSGLSCPEPCTSGTVHVAGGADNGVLVLDLARGSLLARHTFDLSPGRVDAPAAYIDLTANQGAAWFHPTDGVPSLAFLTAAPSGVIEWPLTAQRGIGLFPHFRNRTGAVLVAPWNATSIAGDPVPRPRGYASVTARRFTAGTLSTPLAADGTDWIHFATTAGRETVEWATGAHHAWTATATEPYSMSFTFDRAAGRLLAAMWDGTWYVVRSWSEAEAVAGTGGTVWTSPESLVIGAARLDGTIRAFYWELLDGWPTRVHAVALTDDLVTVPNTDVVLTDVFYSMLAVSPNGRTFLSWDTLPFSIDTSLIVWGDDGAGSFARVATIPLQGQISGAAFDLSGENVYVVTRAPDRILVIQ